MSSLFGFEWAGTIGHNFLSQVVAELNLSAVTFELRRPANRQLKQADWHPIRLNHGIPSLSATVEGRTGQWFQLDTGSGALAIIHGPAVEKLHLLKDRLTRSKPLQGIGGSIDAALGTLREFSVTGHTFSNVPTFFVTGKEGALVDPYVTGTFGAGLLDGFRLIFDYGNRRIAVVR
jgi:hypothetical protein